MPQRVKLWVVELSVSTILNTQKALSGLGSTRNSIGQASSCSCNVSLGHVFGILQMQWSNRFIQPLIVGFLMELARQRVCFVEMLSAMNPCVTVVAVVAWRLELTEGHPKITFGNFTLNALLLYPPHAIEMSLQGRDSYVSILIPDTADLLGLREIAGRVGRICHRASPP